MLTAFVIGCLCDLLPLEGVYLLNAIVVIVVDLLHLRCILNQWIQPSFYFQPHGPHDALYTAASPESILSVSQNSFYFASLTLLSVCVSAWAVYCSTAQML